LNMDHHMLPAATPRILWVELTSKCPFDCVFCSRKSRRGNGEHMPYALFESLVRQVSDPRTFLLNYSGESTVYPELIPAIRLARSTGAGVELVSALASASDSLIHELSTVGLTRLTVSVHAADAGAFAEIYRHSSLAALRRRLELFVELCRGVPNPPAIDLAFVAMQDNLDQLQGVSDWAAGLGLSAITIFPVIRRDEIPIVFPRELTGSGLHRAEFRDALNRRVADCMRRLPEMAITICNPQFTNPTPPLGEAPRACPGELPAGARIYSCEQNPWETAHVLSNGDVVPCEVHDRSPLGNLARQTLAEIWNGAPYQQFRQNYRAGELAACRSCPWKTAYIPGPMKSEILAARGRNAQMGHGWHDPSGEPHVWASQQAVVSLEPRAGSRELHVSGILPPGPAGKPNELEIRCNGAPVGTVATASPEMLPFAMGFAIDAGTLRPWNIEFRTRFAYRPRDRGVGPDSRDLGFALTLVSSQPPFDSDLAQRQRVSLAPLLTAVRRIDRLGRAIGASFRRRRASERPRSLAAGVSVVIPERDTVAELTACLAGLSASARRWDEPIETLVVVNGAPEWRYRELQARYPRVRWQFHAEPLGFGGAIQAGLRRARYDWVYLLNSDVVLEEEALAAAGRRRDPAVFSIASQIVLKDHTRFRDETNLTALFVEEGLAIAHDLIPESTQTVEHFYAGGGASLFQTGLLRQFLDREAYHPFYWEDVEWGWRARKLGYRSLFCAESVARHTQGATVARYFSPAEIETVVERNRLLFQLRNFTTVGSLEAVAKAIARARPEVARYFAGARALGCVARGRLWNHVAPVSDEEVLALARWPS
jgi:GT2 family glycosyltransferase/MoaA/NifB/PqqE/SkfB family radical SAM enzyme